MSSHDAGAAPPLPDQPSRPEVDEVDDEGSAASEEASQAQLQHVFDHAVSLMLAGDTGGAIAAFRDTLALAPWLAAAHINLGLLLSDGAPASLGAAAMAQAEQHYRAALALDPASAHAHLHLGVLLAAQQRFGEAEALYRAALALSPRSLAAWSNLGVLLACTGREDQAARCYRAALDIDPSYGKAHFNLAYLLLRQGRFEEGWPAFEHRDWYGQFAASFGFPRWSGQPLQGQSLLIGIEAGHGDMIQFCRYAALARQAGAARIGIVCHPGLRRLLSRVPAIDSVFSVDGAGSGGALPASGWDYWTPPLSMPLYFGTRIDSIPASLPYLSADPAGTAAMRARLDAVAGDDALQVGLRIGLAWQGNPRFENDADRSLSSLAALAPLARVDGGRSLRFFSLQKGPGELSRGAAGGAGAAQPGMREVEVAPFGAIVDMAPLLDDFADTAALIETLDLVITVDTAVAHLAGALGKPCWVLLPAFKTDWRWLTGRSDSPWYPGSMRLFRQREAGDWAEVVGRVADALRVLAG